ncbi:MAG: hypothetical protein ACR5K4_02475 [Sodalis sp. (in: enterobacteria)]
MVRLQRTGMARIVAVAFIIEESKREYCPMPTQAILPMLANAKKRL